MSSVVPTKVSSSIGSKNKLDKDITALIPDFPFHYARWLKFANQSKQPLFYINPAYKNSPVIIIGGGLSGIISAYEMMRIGLKPVVFECSGYIGGRLKTKLLNGLTPAEMGGMRFPISSKGLFHYFDKVGMTQKMAPFPNPASVKSMGTVIEHLTNKDYFEIDNPYFPIPPKYVKLSDKWEALLNSSPFHYKQFQDLMCEGSINQSKIKDLWNNLLRDSFIQKSYDKVSFYEVLVQAGWDFETIELFGQVGFGSGGWNTDYVNSFLEVLRVAYMALDDNHQLMYDGSQKLVEDLFYKSPRLLGDVVAKGVDDSKSVYTHTRDVFKEIFGEVMKDDILLTAEVHTIYKKNGKVYIKGELTHSKRTFNYSAKTAIYTPHVRVLQMLMGKSTFEKRQYMKNLLDSKTWEAINYTHYMQSSKVFVQTKTPFWQTRNSKGKYIMSTTLSDRLTRGTYLLDYTPVGKGSCICLSYTWNDDSLKFLPYDKKERFKQVKGILEDLYPDINFDKHFNKEHIEILSWESDPYFIGAFKNNLPGQYKYQKQLFSQFINGVDSHDYDPFILAGDDISFTAGWAEGAVSTALNAVHKVALIFEGKSFTGNKGPIDEWETLKPIDIG